MIGTFVIMTLQGFRNRLLHRLRQLRNPRYLVGAIAGAAYFWFAVFRRMGTPLHGKRVLPINELTTGGLSVVVLAMLIFAWALPRDSGGLEFSEAEIALLFPAPLRRRDLLLYKVVRMQPQALISALMLSIIGWRHRNFIGVWLVVSVMSLYFLTVSLARARLKLAGIGFIGRLIGVIAIFGALWWYGTTLFRHFSMGSVQVMAESIRHASSPFQLPAVRALLFIPHLFVDSALPMSTASAVGSCAGLVAMSLMLFYIAAGLNVSFEEASISYSQKRAERVERLRGDRRGRRTVVVRARPLFSLGETGPPEVAIIWKNVIALVRTSIAVVVLLAAVYVFMIVMALWTHHTESFKALGVAMLCIAGLFPFIGPQLFANDLRLDLIRAEVLKSYPLSGDRLVAAELAAPLAVISLFEVAFLLTGAILLRMGQWSKTFTAFVDTTELIIIALLFAVPICTVVLLLRNAVPLYFPAWTIQPKDEARGFVMMGQRLIMLAGNILALIIVLLPALIVLFPSIWIAHRFFAGSAVGLAVASMPAIGILAAEAWLGTKALGARFDDLDIANEFDIVV